VVIALWIHLRTTRNILRFTVYGFLDQAKIEQSLRLVEVTRRPEIIDSPSDPRAKIDARVFTTDLFSNQKTEWSHELVQFDDGSYGHVFKANIGVRCGATYRLEIACNDGKMTTAEAIVPKVDTAFLTPRCLCSTNSALSVTHPDRRPARAEFEYRRLSPFPALHS
jgi:hypothetical protein